MFLTLQTVRSLTPFSLSAKCMHCLISLSPLACNTLQQKVRQSASAEPPFSAITETTLTTKIFKEH